MSKKSRRNRNEHRPKAARRGGLNLSVRGKAYYAATLSALVLLAVSVAATRFDPVRRAVGLTPLAVTPTQNQNLSLSKEYVYAGGRLVATEEPTPAATPTPTPSGPPPTNLVATAEFPSAGVTNVRLTWGPPASGPAVASYVVECKRAGTGFQQVAAVQEPTRTYNDTAVTPDSAYVYRVRAVFTNTGSSDYSQDLATTVAFTDAQLQGVTLKAVHLVELRRAVNAVRALVSGIGAAAWTFPDPVSSPRRAVYLEDVTDLRARLDEALGPLGFQTGGYSANPPLARGALVRAAHFEEIRARVK